MKIAMGIAGFDPSSGSGILRDIITFRKIGVYGVGVATAITEQSTKGVSGYFPLPPELVGQEIDVLMNDMNIKFAKIGMVGNGKIANIIAKKIKEYNLKIIFDPVLRAKNAYPLIDHVKNIEILLKFSFVITPNIPEAEILSGIKIRDEENIIKAGKILREKFGAYIIIKGGHYRGVDYLIGDDIQKLNMEHLGKEVHGTGCAYSSALTAYLVLGYNILDSFKKARVFIQKEIKNSLKIGSGWEVLP